MYFLLILFFASLFGIIFMVGKKLAIIQNGQVQNGGETILKDQFLEEWKHLTVKNIKKHGYKGLTAIIRYYFRSTNLLKNKYKEAEIRIKNMRNKGSSEDSPERREVSKFLKMISDYKHKIRELKHKIKEEEEENR